MQFMFGKNTFLAFVIAIAFSSGGVIVACADSARQATTVTDASAIDHSGMHNMTIDLGAADANYDLRFIDAMIPHHQGAVIMAQDALQKSQRPEIKKLAAEIIKTQNQEIAQLQQWRQAWYPQVKTSPLADAKTNQQISMNLGAADADFDLRFIKAMIPHHEGAVKMAQDALSKSNRPQIKQLSQNIISSQRAEIQQMQQWRQAWDEK